MGPLLQKEYIQQSVTDHGMAEMSEQYIESAGRLHVKNVTERRGSGNDLYTLNLIVRRSTIVNCMGVINNIISYFRDLNGFKNKSRYASLWSASHAQAAMDVSWRDERSRLLLFLFLFCFYFFFILFLFLFQNLHVQTNPHKHNLKFAETHTQTLKTTNNK